MLTNRFMIMLACLISGCVFEAIMLLDLFLIKPYMINHGLENTFKSYSSEIFIAEILIGILAAYVFSSIIINSLNDYYANKPQLDYQKKLKAYNQQVERQQFAERARLVRIARRAQIAEQARLAQIATQAAAEQAITEQTRQAQIAEQNRLAQAREIQARKLAPFAQSISIPNTNQVVHRILQEEG